MNMKAYTCVEFSYTLFRVDVLHRGKLIRRQHNHITLSISISENTRAYTNEEKMQEKKKIVIYKFILQLIIYMFIYM